MLPRCCPLFCVQMLPWRKTPSLAGPPHSALCVHTANTHWVPNKALTQTRSCKGQCRHRIHAADTSQATAKCQDFMEWLHALDPSHVPYNVAWLWWARSQAMHVERIGLVLFPAAWSTVAANHSTDNSQCRLTQWWIMLCSLVLEMGRRDG